MLLFIDTEFSGLGQRWPRLISIGLISEDRQHSFYAELPPESYSKKRSHWVLENVLPNLEGGDCIKQPAELQESLSNWVTQFGMVRIATDSLNYDFKFLQSILDPWPINIDKSPLLLTIEHLNDYHKFGSGVERAFAEGLRRHHALDDAKANLLGWIAAGATATKSKSGV